MRRTLVLTAAVCALGCVTPAEAQESTTADNRLAVLHMRVDALLQELTALKKEIEALKTPRPDATAPPEVRAATAEPPIGAMPRVFLQTRYSTAPLADATLRDYSPNFRVSRAELRWAGSVNSRWGAGIAMQYRAAPDNRPEQLLNDAFIDFYATNTTTVRTGQFVRPFGFDVQQPDAEREAPERAMFAGYVFPGERDRGVMLMGNFSGNCPHCPGLTYAAAVVNGNRMFSDSNRQVNYLFRLRNVRDRIAYGGSVQLGTQITPPGVTQTNDEHVYGVDAQWSPGRLSIRAEFVHANRPSTLFTPEPTFAPAFVAGDRVRTVGTSVTGLWSLTQDRQIYLRFDRLAGDLVTTCPSEKDGSCKINAVNGGLRQRLAQYGMLGVDLQWKDRVSFNHDAVNTRLQVTSSLFF